MVGPMDVRQDPVSGLGFLCVEGPAVTQRELGDGPPILLFFHLLLFSMSRGISSLRCFSPRLLGFARR